MSERCRCAGGGFSRASGTGCPFSTINRTVRCNARVFEKLKYRITATMKIGVPKIARKTIVTIGIAIQGTSEPCVDSVIIGRNIQVFSDLLFDSLLKIVARRTVCRGDGSRGRKSRPW